MKNYIYKMNPNNNIVNQNYIIDCRDYNIENNEYYLRIEIDKEYIYFNLTKITQSLFIYKNKTIIQSILQDFDLKSFKDSNIELKIFDEIYEKNNISIKINDNNSCNLIFKRDNIKNKEKVEIQLIKEYKNENDKLNLIYNELELIKKGRIEYNKQIEEMKNTINEIPKREEDKLNQRNKIIKEIKEILLIEEEIEKINSKMNKIEDILNQKDKIIKDISEKLIKQEKGIKNNIDVINKRIKETETENKLINNLNNEIKMQNNKLENNIGEIEIIKNQCNEIIKEINIIKNQK